MSEPLRILSLGAGVQSSVLAMMSALGELPRLDAAIFADTQAEPRSVYDFFEKLKAMVEEAPHPFHIHLVTAGNLEEDFLNVLSGKKKRCGQPPFITKEGDARPGRLWRQCTQDYKIHPIRQQVRKVMEDHGVKASEGAIEQWIGITTDEASRMKPSGVKYIAHRWPLIELSMSRNHCIEWAAEHNLPIPPKSACYFCPYMNDDRLREMRDKEPEEWQRAIEFDKKLRSMRVDGGCGIRGDIYIHRSGKPLDEVDLSTDYDRGQLNMFNEECEGMCGL